jgi:hypothetical protein
MCCQPTTARCAKCVVVKTAILAWHLHIFLHKHSSLLSAPNEQVSVPAGHVIPLMQADVYMQQPNWSPRLRQANSGVRSTCTLHHGAVPPLQASQPLPESVGIPALPASHLCAMTDRDYDDDNGIGSNLCILQVVYTCTAVSAALQSAGMDTMRLLLFMQAEVMRCDSCRHLMI